MFSKGEYVVYGNHGVCYVEDITYLNMPGSDTERLYYVLRPTNAKGSTVYSPTDNVRVPLRTVMTTEEAQEVLEEMPQIHEAEVANERFREETYKEIMKSCDFRQIAGLTKLLVKRRKQRLKQGRKFTSLDERYLKASDDFLSSELSQALGESKRSVISIWDGE